MQQARGVDDHPVASAPPIAPPDLGVRRLLLVGTGALSVSMLPFWLNWLRRTYPDLELRIVLTRSAHRFVSAEAVAAISRAEVATDTWEGGDILRPAHIELARWSELIVVYPATAHFLSRFALGLMDSPLLLALQAFTGPVGVAPALPPGVHDSIAMKRHLRALGDDPRVVVAPTTPQRSHTTGQVDDGGAVPLPVLLSLIAKRRAQQAVTA